MPLLCFAHFNAVFDNGKEVAQSFLFFSLSIQLSIYRNMNFCLWICLLINFSVLGGKFLMKIKL